MDAALHALNRFGLGARSGERRRVTDPKAWLRRQLDGGPPLISAPPAATPSAVAAAIRAFRGPARQTPQQRQQLRRALVDIGAQESVAALTMRVTTDRPFVERLVAFWSNHLCVSTAAKVLVVPLAGSYEREAIRPHVLGRFEDLVLASAKHPAMLVYLDNFQSIGPGSRGGVRGRGRRGLNENYARELMELHTLGVNGGYTQQDVQELAKILTGWTVSGLQNGAARLRGAASARQADIEIGFGFQDLLHEPGTRTVLGVKYSDRGVEQGERVIRDLCRHPSTATFVATKLVTHFVADDPPPAAVDRIARVFRSSGGDLRAVSAALIDLPEAWADGPKKFRTPQDWLVAVLRAVDAPAVNAMTPPVLRQLRHPLWAPQSPKGFGDTMAEWADPDSLLNRAELARTLARRLRDAGIDAAAVLDVIDAGSAGALHTLLKDTAIPAGDRVALAIAGPAFQWR
jgi:uncharacterized protein (DUF1800 family)